ncbi:hypothetical protein CCACVL1_15261 [Corchorus capsularis]|uniref:Uncharacterized protein n=1 Tax=Corchorus capsularis TaxID=210143 RepID=A0A1R3I317_COCAP|nr:hypothetical protein CCACVL1_15261 [Corchorus capsularis]
MEARVLDSKLEAQRDGIGIYRKTQYKYLWSAWGLGPEAISIREFIKILKKGMEF